MAEMLTTKPAVVQGESGEPVLLGQQMVQSMPTREIPMDPFDLDPFVRDYWPQESCHNYAQIMRQCLEPDPKLRPSSREVVSLLAALLRFDVPLCLMCSTNPPKGKFQCGHAVMCETCAHYSMDRGIGCPLCHSPIASLKPGCFSRFFLN